MIHYSRRNRIKEFISYLSYTLELYEYPNPYWYGIPSHLFEIPRTKSPHKLQTSILFKTSQRRCFWILFTSEATRPILLIYRPFSYIKSWQTFLVFFNLGQQFTFLFDLTASTMFSSPFYSIDNDLFLLVRSWKQRQQFIVPWKTASRHCSVQRLWLDVFHASTALELKVSYSATTNVSWWSQNNSRWEND